MTPERWQRVESLVQAALERTPALRAEFLDETCGGDAELRREVESLLDYYQCAEAQDFIGEPPYRVAADVLSAAASEPLVGRTLGPYRIERQLGRGGMGEIYFAVDIRLGRPVALKFLPASFTSDAERVRRFEREARATSALNHPNIVTVHEIVEVEGLRFIVTEYVAGETLRDLMARGRLPLEQALDIAAQTATGLAAAHTAGVVHRDIKPENVMVRPDGYVKILDFGLAKPAKWNATLSASGTESETLIKLSTSPGMLMGTVNYMSPEQARGQKLDARTDVWSLGVVLYEMITGQRPFDGDTTSDALAAILLSTPVPLATHNQELPTELSRIVDKVLQKEREERYQTALELLMDVKSLQRRIEIREEMERSGATLATDVTDMAAGDEILFVGRDTELGRLDERLRDAVAGQGRLVFLTGEAGIGKTALADAFLRRARRRYPTLIRGRGRCLEQYGTGEAYLPFLDALGMLLTGRHHESVRPIMQTYAPTWCLQFPATFSGVDRERLQRETIGANKDRMLREMGDALGALATNAPVVLLLEDLHWADSSTVDLLRHLAQRLPEQRLLLVGTFRPEDVELTNHPLKNCKRELQAHNLCEEIALGALDEGQLAAYLDARFVPHDLPREFVTLLERKTEGHSLFATSLVEFLAERGDIGQRNGRWTLTRSLAEMDLEIPESIRSMIRRKIEALSEEERRALTYASIEGEEFLSTVLAELLGVSEVVIEEQLDRLDRVHRLIHARGEEELPDGTLAIRYRFAHALYQNVLYEELVSKRRILLHRHAGEQLLKHYGAQSPMIATQLALHFERGRDFRRAVEYLTHAGDSVATIYAYSEAAANYTRALDLLTKLPAAEQAAPSLNIHQKRATAYTALSRFDRAVADLTKVLEYARSVGDATLEATALMGLATVLFFAHSFGEMKSLAEDAIRAAERAGKDEVRIGATMMLALWHLAYSGDLARVRDLLDEVIPTARALDYKPGLCSALCHRGTAHFFQSEYDRAEATLMEAHALALELRDGFVQLISLFFLGLSKANMGRMSEGLAALTEALELAQRNGDHFFLPRLPNCIGWIYRELQDFDRAFKYDLQGVEIARADDVAEAEANSLINLGYNYTHTGEAEQAQAAFRAVEACFARDDWNRWRYNLRLQAGAAEHWLAKGEVGQTEAYAQRLLEAATRHGVGKYIAVAHQLLAEVAVAREHLAEAEAELSAALDELRMHPVPILAWKTNAALGRLRLRMGQRDAARESFARASEVVEHIAANVSDEKLRATFLNSASVREILEHSDSHRS